MRLTATAPRFIFRYYVLHEQIQRLNLSVPTAEGQQFGLFHLRPHFLLPAHPFADQENPNTGDPEQDHGTQEEAPSHAVESEDQFTHEQTEVPGDTPGSYLPLSTTTSPVPQATVDKADHATADHETDALGNENDYEEAEVTVKDTSTEEVEDADHALNSTDPDHGATPVAEYYKSGGEQAGYQESLLPEEFDDRDEEFGDDAHGDSQFDDASQYEAAELGEGHNDSADVDELRPVLADSGPDAATPLPLRSPLLPEDSPNHRIQNLPTGMRGHFLPCLSGEPFIYPEHDTESQAEVEKYDDESLYQTEKGKFTGFSVIHHTLIFMLDIQGEYSTQLGVNCAPTEEQDVPTYHDYEAGVLNTWYPQAILTIPIRLCLKPPNRGERSPYVSNGR